MDKNDWELALERVGEIYDNAKDNYEKAKKDMEEIEFMQKHYKAKIETFK